jgi:transcription termination factor NusB
LNNRETKLLNKKNDFKNKFFLYIKNLQQGCMTEAEHLDRLLQMIVQKEMRRLTQLSTHANVWNILCHQYFILYGKRK